MLYQTKRNSSFGASRIEESVIIVKESGIIVKRTNVSHSTSSQSYFKLLIR